MATRLSLYNEALRILGERKLASLTEDRPIRRHLDDVWDDQGVRRVLELGFWNFAIRTVKATFSPAIAPEFGFKRGFDKPLDYVRTAALTSDEHFQTPLLEYMDEVEHWFCDLDEIYVRYVSDDNAYGGDLSKWTGAFSNMAAHYFALQVVSFVTKGEEKKDGLQKDFKKSLTTARSQDAMNQPTAFPPTGSWVGSRLFGSQSRRDRGNRGSLTG